MTVLPVRFGQFFLMVSQYVASSFGTEPVVAVPLDAVPEAAAPEEEAEPLALGAELLATEGADEATLAAELALLLPPALAVVLDELLHADRTNATAPIPAMVAIALLADVRDTRPPPFLGKKSCEGAHNRPNESVFNGGWQVLIGDPPVTIA